MSGQTIYPNGRIVTPEQAAEYLTAAFKTHDHFQMTAALRKITRFVKAYVKPLIICAQCGASFPASRTDRRFCSHRCRNLNHRHQRKAPDRARAA
jgi:predicted nucleic acid-binding Zn ribbon protein